MTENSGGGGDRSSPLKSREGAKGLRQRLAWQLQELKGKVSRWNQRKETAAAGGAAGDQDMKHTGKSLDVTCSPAGRARTPGPGPGKCIGGAKPRNGMFLF